MLVISPARQKTLKKLTDLLRCAAVSFCPVPEGEL
jgi:hypothetical protein